MVSFVLHRALWLIEELEPVTVNSCAVVYENDEDFGQLSMIPLYGHSANLANLNEPSAKIYQESLQHLTESQKLELFEVLDKYPECFSETFYRCGDSLYTSEGWF